MVIPELNKDSKQPRDLQEVAKKITAWTQTRTPQEVTDILQNSGVAAVPVMTVEDQFSDRHFNQRAIHVRVKHPIVGLEMIYGIPWRLSKTPGKVRRPAPSLGEHNRLVLCDILGLSSTEFDRLDKEGALS